MSFNNLAFTHMYRVKYCDSLLAYLDSEFVVVALLHKCVGKYHANLQRI